jgi:hypothetical protein
MGWFRPKTPDEIVDDAHRRADEWHSSSPRRSQVMKILQATMEEGDAKPGTPEREAAMKRNGEIRSRSKSSEQLAANEAARRHGHLGPRYGR